MHGAASGPSRIAPMAGVPGGEMQRAADLEMSLAKAVPADGAVNRANPRDLLGTNCIVSRGVPRL